MEILGILLIVFGGLFAFVFGLALVLSREESDGVSAFEWSDVFLFGGLLSFIRGLAKGISDAFHDRKSTAFFLAAGFIASVLVTAAGVFTYLAAS
jgi:hypothetical protein